MLLPGGFDFVIDGFPLGDGAAESSELGFLAVERVGLRIRGIGAADAIAAEVHGLQVITVPAAVLHAEADGEFGV